MSRVRLICGVLLGSVALGVAWGGYARSIAPWVQSEKESREMSASLKVDLARARAAIQEVRVLERDADGARREMNRLAQEIPAGSAMIWLPELVKTHFTGFGMSRIFVRMNTVRETPELPGFRRGYWSVGLPLAEESRSAGRAFLAVAEFEQQHPFVKVLDFAIRPDPEHPQARIALLNVAALIRK